MKAPEATRRKLLEAAFGEFYANGFQGGSLNHIVEKAEATKGALFHHFESKQALGLAVLDELIGPLLLQRWLDPVQGSDDPLTDIQRAFTRYVAEDLSSGMWLQGCPLNNLAQEMSPLDPGFRSASIGCTPSGASATARRSSPASRPVRSSRRPRRRIWPRRSWPRRWASGAAARAPATGKSCGARPTACAPTWSRYGREFLCGTHTDWSASDLKMEVPAS